jgi:hypothetical protein
MVAQVGYSVAKRSRGQVTPCAICTMHEETSSAGFFVEPQNQGRRFVSGLASKPLGRFLQVWPQTGSDGFSRFGLKTGGDGFDRFGLKTGGSGLASKLVVEGFPVWASKPVATVWGFGPQNHQQFFGLCLKTMRATVCQLHHIN